MTIMLTAVRDVLSANTIRFRRKSRFLLVCSGMGLMAGAWMVKPSLQEADAQPNFDKDIKPTLERNRPLS